VDVGPAVRSNRLRDNDSRLGDCVSCIFLGTPITSLAEMRSCSNLYRPVDLDINISRVAHADVRNDSSFVVLVAHYRSNNCWIFFFIVFCARAYQG